jgi:hypothetical protein
MTNHLVSGDFKTSAGEGAGTSTTENPSRQGMSSSLWLLQIQDIVSSRSLGQNTKAHTSPRFLSPT